MTVTKSLESLLFSADFKEAMPPQGWSGVCHLVTRKHLSLLLKSKLVSFVLTQYPGLTTCWGVGNTCPTEKSLGD